MTFQIEFLQIRNGTIDILDDKPDATTNKPLAQLPARHRQGMAQQAFLDARTYLF